MPPARPSRERGSADPDGPRSRARYNRIIRFATRVMLATWWFDVALPRIGLGRVAERTEFSRACRHPRGASACSPSTSAAS